MSSPKLTPTHQRESILWPGTRPHQRHILRSMFALITLTFCLLIPLALILFVVWCTQQQR